VDVIAIRDYYLGMELVLDDDVKAVAEFMQGSISAHRLVAVATGVAQLASLLWGQYQSENVEVLRLVRPAPTTSSCDPRIQSSASV